MFKINHIFEEIRISIEVIPPLDKMINTDIMAHLVLIDDTCDFWVWDQLAANTIFSGLDGMVLNNEIDSHLRYEEK